MHFVAALDAVPEMRAVLALVEGVATGAADGHARMPDRAAPPQPASGEVVERIAGVLRGAGPAALLLGGRALREPGLRAAARVAAASGAQLLAETFPTRLERGAGLPPVERLAYLAEFASVQ